MNYAGTGLMAGLFCIGLLLPFGNSAKAEDAAPADSQKAFFDSIDGEYGSPARVKSTEGGVIRLDGTRKLYSFKGDCYPIRDLFGPDVEDINWDNKKKMAVIRNKGKELILNFGSGDFTPGDKQVVMPKEWIRFENGKSEISLSFLNAVYQLYPFVDDDIEKVHQEWKERLSFLGIAGANGVTDHIFMIHHVGLYFPEKYKDPAKFD